MSLSTLAVRALQRKPVGLADDAATPASGTSAYVANALSAAAAYVPTEVLALYTFILGLMVTDKPGPGETALTHLPVWSYWAFVSGTVVATLLIFIARALSTSPQKTLPKRLRDWPVWEVPSAAVGFTVWSMAIPNGPFVDYVWYTPKTAAMILAIFSVSWPIVGAGVVPSLRRDAVSK